MQEDAKSDLRSNYYIALALLAALSSTGENAIDTWVLHLRAIDGNDWLVAPLAYLVIAYWLGTCINLIHNFLLVRRLNHKTSAQNDTNLPKTIIWRPPRKMQIWAFIAAFLLAASSLPLFWAYSQFDPSIVVPLTNVSALYLALWQLSAPKLYHYSWFSRWFQVDEKAAFSPQALILPGLGVVFGAFLTSLKQFNFDIFNIEHLIITFLLLAVLQQILSTLSKIASDQGMRIENVNASTFSFWRVFWSALVTTLIVPLFAYPTGRLPALLSVWEAMSSGGMVLGLIPIGLATLGWIIIRVILLNRTNIYTNRAYQLGKGAVGLVTVLTSLQIPLGVFLAFVVYEAGLAWFGTIVLDPRIWWLKIFGALVILIAVAYLATNLIRARQRATADEEKL